MSDDDYLEYFDPDFSVSEDELCRSGGAHAYVEEYNNEEVQILRCKRCGKRSVGYIDPKFIFLLENE